MVICPHCPYTTSRNYNLNRHIRSKHSNIPQIINQDVNVTITQNTENIQNEVINLQDNSININENFINIQEEPISRYKCRNCYKTFATRYNLRKHNPICKHILDPLQCNMCLRVFASPQSLCGHKKLCKIEISKYDDTFEKKVDCELALEASLKAKLPILKELVSDIEKYLTTIDKL